MVLPSDETDEHNERPEGHDEEMHVFQIQHMA